MINRLPVSAKVVIAPVLIMLLMIGVIATALLALHQQQSAFFTVIRGSFKTSHMTTKLLLSVAEVQSDVLRYVQLESRFAAATDPLLVELRRSIKSRYAAIETVFNQLKTTTSGSGESDAVSNIQDFLTIHRAVSLRIIDGQSSGTMTVSTLMAHYQQLQSYIVELASRTAESASSAEQEAAIYVSRMSRFILLGALGVVMISALIAYYVGRAISRPLIEMISALTAIAEGNATVSVPGLTRRDELGQMARAVDVFASVSRDLREREQSLEEARKHAEIANATKSKFLASMSHELRTPLNAIIGFSEMLAERMPGDLNVKQAQFVKHIHDSGEHLLCLINDILDLSKVEAGKMELTLEKFPLAPAIDTTVSMFKERAARQGLTIRTSIADGLGDIVADERKFKQILLNLLSNAVKFTPPGGTVEVSAGSTPEAVHVSVRDTGIGISTQDHQAVFEEFRQVAGEYTRKAGGTGLGLTLTRKFVELHGGCMNLESEPGKGSTFSFTLPKNRAVTDRAA